MLLTRMSLESEAQYGNPSKPIAFQPGDHVHPKENDIILGRGNLHASHPGNIRFYKIIDQHIPNYNAAHTRTDKTKVVQDIYDEITSAGRFVKDDPASAACVVIETNAAKKKISHAIRFRLEAGRRSPASLGKSKSRSPDPRSRLSFQCAKRKYKETQQQRSQQHPTRQVPIQHRVQERNASCDDDGSADCIIPDEELSSVLLLPPHEMDEVSQMYEAFIRDNQARDIRSRTTQTPIDSKMGTGNSRAAGKTDDATPFDPTMDDTTSSPTLYPINLPDWSFPP
mmetsp:Transcript_5109/g.9773  ORF Transcript_5109/g.9773 Transcript_5109/m.9773 type:complete len:283 (-) Transcript_5109:229-1077(-)